MPATEEAWWAAFMEALRNALRSTVPAMPPGLLAPQSFSDSQLPSAALATAGAGPINSNNTVINIEQVLGPNTDAGGVYAATSSAIRDELVQRRING